MGTGVCRSGLARTQLNARSRRDRRERNAGRSVRRNRPLRPCANVLGARAAAVVLDAPQAGLFKNWPATRTPGRSGSASAWAWRRGGCSSIGPSFARGQSRGTPWCDGWARSGGGSSKLLKRGAASGCRAFQGLCRELYEHRQRLWRFLRHENVEPTNNASERALRHAVIWRKLSFGTQSDAGSRFVETMLTVVETCRQQKRSAFHYLVQALEAQAAGRQAPSLLSGA
jgi:hypothetical protein